MPQESAPRLFSFREGANTTSLGHTSGFPIWQVFDDARIDQDVSRRRLGKTQIARFASVDDLIVFDGASNYIDFDSYVAKFVPLNIRFTLETLFKTTSLAADRYILSQWASTILEVKHTTAGAVVVSFVDSGSTTTTLTWTGVTVNTVCALQVVRDGASLIGRLNGTTQSATVSATNLSLSGTGTWRIGAARPGGVSKYHAGLIDYIRLLSTAEADQRHAYLRLPNPKANNVVFDYVCRPDPQGSAYVIDRGPNEMNATTSGAITSTGAAIAYNSAPVIGLASTQDTTLRQRGYAFVGHRVYPLRYD